MRHLALNVLICMLLSTAATCQPENAIVKIQFTTATRGYQKQVFISADSVIEIVEGRQQDNRILRRALAEGDWKNVLESAKDIKPESLASLQSPTSRRAFDGARSSRIKLIRKDGKEFEHTFDDENPHSDLKPLMDAILAIQSASLER
jgi:hypothetical protein